MSDYSDKLKQYANQVSILQSEQHRFRAENAALKERITEANKERAWVRRKLELPEDTGFLSGDVTLAGTMHCVWSGYKGYHNYILAEKCDDKMGEIARQSVEIESLKGQVAQLTGWKEVADNHYGCIESLEDQLTTLQSKSAALMDALNGIVYSRPLVDQQIQLEILAALAAFKGDK